LHHYVWDWDERFIKGRKPSTQTNNEIEKKEGALKTFSGRGGMTKLGPRGAKKWEAMIALRRTSSGGVTIVVSIAGGR